MKLISQKVYIEMDVKTVLCHLNDIPDSGAYGVDGADIDGPFSLILLQRNNNVYAYHNECPHAGRRLDWAPGKFLLEDDQIVCAAHGASFQIQSGKCQSGPCRGANLRQCQIEIKADVIYLLKK